MDGVQVTFKMAALENLIRHIAEEVAAKMEADRSRVAGRLSFNIQEAAALTGLSVGTLRTARAEGRIRGSIIGRELVFERSELLKLIRESQD